MTPSSLPPAAGTRRLLPLAAALATALLLVACASPGPAHQPRAASTAQAAGLADAGQDASAAPAQWWRALGDSQLDALVERALQDNPSLAVGRARLAQAVALSQVREAANGPQATLGVDFSRQHYTAHGLVPAPVAGNSYSTGNIQASLSWSPDFFGQHAAELEAALGQARAAQADAAAAANLLAANVARAHVGLARLLAQRAVAERALAQRQEQVSLTQQRVGAGLDSQVELTQSQAAVPDARTQIEALDEQITLARRQLAVLSGQAPGALAGLTPRLDALQPPAVPPTLGTDLLGRRPDVVAARWRIEAATQGVAVARSEFYPNVNLTAFVGLNALGLDRLFNAGSRQLGVAPALRLPIFDGGRLRAQLGGRQAELDMAIAQYNGAVLDAAREAGDALASIASLARQQEQQAEAAASAEKAYRFAQERYRAGLGTYLVVLSTESQVLAQRRLAVDLRARQLDTRIALMKALGGGWQDDTAMLQTAAR
ncbi:efflux transporter outer membrane subunit [Acidovorax sp. 210-6]|uniref:efflux transporter outer membrane subunit n=1 Tax=Acidovorax sp. 210-6 TaxID=2699468 RepID=UPI00138A4ECA|nr:efflux transporter outer membrane subunit [Acidovorax sp. 210-6]NCU66280.1 efflux transporter outer membrane subunit [Acidovorax sp. 210-6]